MVAPDIGQFAQPNPQAAPAAPAAPPSLGAAAQPAPIEIRPPSSPAEEEQLRFEWKEFFQSPQAQAALLQFGISFGQPLAPGQTLLGHGLSAIGEGAAAAGRATEIQQQRSAAANVERREDARLALDTRRTTAIEEGVEVQREAITSRENIAQRELDVQAEAQKATDAFRQRQLDFEQKRLDLSADQLQAQQDQFEAQLRHDTDLLATRLNAEANLKASTAQLGLLSELLSADIQAASLELRPANPLGVVDVWRQVMTRLESGTGDNLPASATELSDAQISAIVSNPTRLANAQQLWPDFTLVAQGRGLLQAEPSAGPAPQGPAAPATPGAGGPAQNAPITALQPPNPATIQPGGPAPGTFTGMDDRELEIERLRLSRALARARVPGEQIVDGLNQQQIFELLQQIETEQLRRQNTINVPGT